MLKKSTVNRREELLEKLQKESVIVELQRRA